MVAEYRREYILGLARDGKELSIEEMARHFEVSRETVRRDLMHLQARGLLRRVHGGAVPAQTGTEAGFGERLINNAGAKKAIAMAAAKRLRQGDTLMIDTGTTTAILASVLAETPKMTIITNCFSVAGNLAAGASAHRVYLLGGEFRVESQQTLGSACLDQIAHYRADHAILSCGAVDVAGGLMDFDFEDAMVARAMIEQSQRLTLIVDQTKFNRVAMAKVCDIDMIDTLITDAQPPAEILDAIAANDIELVIA